jgi:hypothetical protein
MPKSIPWKHMRTEKSRESVIARLQREERAKAQWFISQLVKSGVPRSAIATNDFSSNLVPRVYITIPYGKIGGGKQKGYQRWNATTVKQAVKFYKTGGGR